MDEAVHLSLEDYINHMIDAFDHFVAANPGYRAVFVQSSDLDRNCGNGHGV